MVKLFSDSDFDLPQDLIEKYDIGVIPFGISYGDETYYQGYYELNSADFYERCRETDAWPKTSQPVASQYEDLFRPALENGDDVLCFCITSKFSGSYQSAVMAKENLQPEFPGRRIELFDTQRCTVLHGYTVYQACLLLESGATIDEILSVLVPMKEDYCVLISVDSLEYLRKGGRLGKAGALAGSLLNIKPIIGMRNGELIPYSKVRGKKNAVAEIIKGINKFVGENKNDYVAISFTSDIPEDTELIARELTKNGFETVHKWEIGPVVGAHVGPTAFAAAVFKKYAGQNIF